MKKSDDKKIEDIAAKINDGELDLSITEQFDSKDAKKIVSALQKIQHVAQTIRNQSTVQGIAENEEWAHLIIKNKIGQGGIGEVYRAFDSVLSCDVAVKFLNQKSQLYISTEQFLQEARNMAKVRHPHVLAIHGATTDKKLAGYWSDYLDGQTLSESLKEGSLSWKKQLSYSKELASALLQIHKNKIVHGDIKPQNVMIQPNRGAILLDFGSSRKQKVKDSNQKLVQASPMAMAPEQFDGQIPTQASDIFSLGLLFWNLNTGKHPLDGKNIEDIAQQTKQLTNKKYILKGLKDWKKLILNMVDNNPDNRPSISQVVHKLEEIEQKPIKKARRIAYVALLALAVGIALISAYSNYKTKQASAETQILNNLLTDILLKSSPIEAGKDTLLIDVLSETESALFNNKNISSKQKVFYLTQLVKTYRRQGKAQKSIDLASKLLAFENISDSLKLDLLMQKSAGLNENKNYKQAQELLLQAIKIKPSNPQDADVLVSTLITLIFSYNESYQLEKVPALLKQAKSLIPQGTGKLSYVANLALIEGNYWEIKEQYTKAYKFYQKAIENFSQHYGKKNLDTLIAKGAAATVLTYQESTREKGVQQLENVITEMTEFLGKEHSSTLIARINLADAYAQLDKPQKALNSIIPHMQDVYKTYGKEGGMTLVFKNMIAGFYHQADKNQQAIDMLREIIEINSKKHGQTAQQTLEAQLNYAMLLQDINELSQAKPLLEQIYLQAQDNLGDDARLTLDIQEYVLWNMFLQGDKIAVISMQELLDKKIKIFGEQDPSIISTQKHLNEMKK